MKRYEPFHTHAGEYAGMVEGAFGRFVLHEEANARIDELTAEVASLRAALQEAITHMYSDAKVRELYVARENARNALKETK